MSTCETSTSTAAVQSNGPTTASNPSSQLTHGVECVNTLAPGGLICCVLIVLLLCVVPVRVLQQRFRRYLFCCFSDLEAESRIFIVGNIPFIIVKKNMFRFLEHVRVYE